MGKALWLHYECTYKINLNIFVENIFISFLYLKYPCFNLNDNNNGVIKSNENIVHKDFQNK